MCHGLCAIPDVRDTLQMLPAFGRLGFAEIVDIPRLRQKNHFNFPLPDPKMQKKSPTCGTWENWGKLNCEPVMWCSCDGRWSRDFLLVKKI